MFTGIIEELGQVVTVGHDGGTVVSVRADRVGVDVPHGASIAINGVCLTVVGDRVDGGSHVLDFDVMGETLARTNIGDLAPGGQVNLERAVRADSRLDGHIVQGHVDGTAIVLSRTPGTAWESVRFALPADLARYVAEKGSITVDGVSLTVSAVGHGDPLPADPLPADALPADALPADASESAGDWFEVGLIPETLRATTLGRAGVGTVVNLEVDVLAKYTERLLQARGVLA